MTRKIFGILLVAMTPFFIILFSTKNGIDLNVDSKVYLEGAKNLKLGIGYKMYSPAKNETTRIKKWPIGTSLIISFVLDGRNIIDQLESIKLLYTVIFIINILLLYWIILNITSNSALAAVFTIFSSIHLTISSVHLGVYSEPAFLTMTFLGISFFIYSDSSKNKKFHILSAILCFAISILFRYAGFFTLIGFITFLFAVNFDPKKKIHIAYLISTILISCISCLIIYQLGVGRELVVSSNFSVQLKRIINYFLEWVNPYLGVNLFGEIFKLLLIMAIAYFFSYSFSTSFKNKSYYKYFMLFTILSGTYFVGYFIHLFLLDPTASIDERTLLPTLIYSILILAILFKNIVLDHNGSFSLRNLIILFTLVFFTSNTIYSFSSFFEFNRNSIGLNSLDYRDSELFKKSRDINGKIYSNEPSSMFFHSSKNTEISPLKRNFISNEKIPFDIEKYNSGDYFVIIKRYEDIRKRWLYNKDELDKLLNLTTIFEDNIGTILVVL